MCERWFLCLAQVTKTRRHECMHVRTDVAVLQTIEEVADKMSSLLLSAEATPLQGIVLEQIAKVSLSGALECSHSYT